MRSRPRLAVTLHRHGRVRCYALLAAVMFAAAIGARAMQSRRDHDRLNFVVSDARFYYVYLPSVVIDRDLDFSNQIASAWGNEFELELLGDRTPTGLVANKSPIGMALTLFPAFVSGHGFVLGANHLSGREIFAADGYSAPYQLPCLALVLGLACATMALLDRLIEDEFDLDGRAIALGVVAFWIGSHYAWYSFREPFMVHVVSTFWVTATIYLCGKIRRVAARDRRLAAADVLRLGFALAMAMICRPTNVFVAPFVLWAMIAILRAGLGGRLMRLAPIALVVSFLPIVVQLGTWRALYGSWVCNSYGDERFLWARPALWQTLFSLTKGLFIWTPLLLLAAVGLLLHLAGVIPTAGRQGLVICSLLSATILWYLNSAWWCWGFGWAFGGRAFLELTPVFVVGLALTCHWVKLQPPILQRAVAGALVVLVLYNYTLMGLYQSGVLARGAGAAMDALPKRVLAKLERERQQTPHIAQARTDP
jgi:hypothetical protein